MVACALTNFFDAEGNQTIINVDVASGLHDLSDVLVVEPQNFLVTFLHVLVIECELDGLTLLELNLSSATLNESREREREHLFIVQDENCCMKPSYSYLCNKSKMASEEPS